MKGIALASLTIVLFLVPCLSPARNVSVDLRPIQQNLNVGDEISVNVRIDQVSDLKGIHILVSFDNVRLEYESTTKGILIDGFEEDIVPDQELSETEGRMEYMAVLGERGPGMDSPGGTILTLDFVARSPGAAWIKLDSNDVALGDSMASVIPAAIDTERQTIQIGEIPRLERVFNYPNPAPDAEGNTVIRIEALALLEELEARIYDVSGELVRTIGHEGFDRSNAPVYDYVWDCKNDEDRDVANGTYILWVKANFGSDEKHETWKIAVRR